MDEKSLYPAAKALAETQPNQLGQVTFPLIHWWQEGDQIGVILADGRKVRGPMPEEKAKKPAPSPVMALPVREIHAPDKAMSSGKVAGKK